MYPSCSLRAACFLPLALVLLPLPARAAQEVAWRMDYNTARREANEKNRPLVIDFGTENCFWCKKLDAITFKDPAVASLMNERFIPLRIDAEKDAPLATALRIQSYPTIVLASADGKILDMQEGFLEAPRLVDKLQRVLATLPSPTPPPPPLPSDPDWMVRDYDGAAKAIAASDYAAAVALLKHVLEDGQQRPVQVKSRQLLQDLEQQAAGRLARAKQLVDKGQAEEAMQTVTQLIRTFAGTQAAKDGGQMLTSLSNTPDVKTTQRSKRAREVLAQAREDYRTQQYLTCLNRCEMLLTSFPDLPEGNEAMQLAAEIKANPEWMRQACDSLSDQLGVLYLSLAETWLKKGQPEQAVLCLERVVQTLPGTRQAEAAQTRLAQIQGQPTQPVTFKK
jgi:thiol-disulfide isomerase/thioredoxin